MDNYTPKREEEALPKSRLGRLILRTRRKLASHLWLARGMMLGLIAIVLVAAWLVLRVPLSGLSANIFFLPKMGVLFLTGHPENLHNESGRINILLLGKGGANHEAPDLTDTIILASVPLQKGEVDLISVPRDVWIPSLRAKINSTYYYGNQKKDGGGLILTKAAVSEILNKPVHYAVIVDFTSFEKMIDLLGGVKIKVDRSFDDFKYPIPGRENDLCDGDRDFKCRYEHVHFESGEQTMNGETALKFVRSRNAEGEEGSDFARSARQQKVLSALKDRILSPNIIFNPSKLMSVWQVIESNLETDLRETDWPVLARLIFNHRDSVKSSSIEELLIHPPVSVRYDNQWVLVPKSGSWEEVQQWVVHQLSP
ncbi:LCP family protein [Candidatus Microgenomates bacterium]|nr:LCP family protein [Candidatus Microgenomates bacterium]